MRSIVLLSAPVLPFGLIYFVGWWVIAAVVLLAACTLLSCRDALAEPPSRAEDENHSSFGFATTHAAGL